MPVPPVRIRAASRPGALALAMALLLAACGGATGSTGSTPSPIPPGPTPVAPSASPVSAAPGILLEVTTEGGFINPAATIGALPLVVVDTDGRVFTPAAGPAPTRLIPAVDVRDTGAAGAAAIRDAMRVAGLDVEGAQGADGGVVPDAGTTVFTALVGGTEVVNRVSGAGLGGPVGGPGQPGRPGGSDGAPGSPASAALALLARLTDVTQAWGSSTPPVVARFAPSAFRAWIAPAPVDVSGAATVPWPLAGEPSGFGTPAAADLGVAGLRSGTVAGADAVALGAALATAPQGTLLAAGDGSWQVWVRPLLPDETGG